MPAPFSWRILFSDKVLAGVYLVSLAGFWISSYLFSYLNQNGFPLMWAAILLLLTTGASGVVLVGTPFVSESGRSPTATSGRKAGRAVQVFLRLTFLSAGLLAAAAWYRRAPAAALLGHLHRAQAISRSDSWQECADWLSRGCDRDHSFRAEQIYSIPGQPAAARFAKNWEVWGLPEVDILVTDEGSKQVRFAWGGLTGRWGIVVCPPGRQPAAPDSGHIGGYRHWEGNVWVWTGD